MSSSAPPHGSQHPRRRVKTAGATLRPEAQTPAASAPDAEPMRALRFPAELRGVERLLDEGRRQALDARQ